MYNYEKEKHAIFTEEGQRNFLKVRDQADELLKSAGAFQMLSPTKGITGDVWTTMAYVDRLVELGEIREITGPEVAGQHRVFVSARR